jgi:hypothetical protein
MAELDANSALISIDATTLQWVTADWSEAKDITDVPPDTATNGKKIIDPDVYQGTLSVTANFGAVSYGSSAVEALETAYDTGGTSNDVVVIVQFDSGAATYKDTANMMVVSKSEPKGIVGAQQVTYELRTNGDITRTRP